MYIPTPLNAESTYLLTLPLVLTVFLENTITVFFLIFALNLHFLQNASVKIHLTITSLKMVLFLSSIPFTIFKRLLYSSPNNRTRNLLKRCLPQHPSESNDLLSSSNRAVSLQQPCRSNLELLSRSRMKSTYVNAISLKYQQQRTQKSL